MNTSRLLPQTPSAHQRGGQGLSLGRRVLHTRAISTSTAEKLHEVQRGVRPLHAFNLEDVLPELRPLVIEALANPNVRIVSLLGSGDRTGAGGGLGDSGARTLTTAGTVAEASAETAGTAGTTEAAVATAAAAAAANATSSTETQLRAAMQQRAALEFELRRREREKISQSHTVR